jgi:hypothetical protein
VHRVAQPGPTEDSGAAASTQQASDDARNDTGRRIEHLYFLDASQDVMKVHPGGLPRSQGGESPDWICGLLSRESRRRGLVSPRSTRPFPDR